MRGESLGEVAEQEPNVAFLDEEQDAHRDEEADALPHRHEHVGEVAALVQVGLQLAQRFDKRNRRMFGQVVLPPSHGNHKDRHWDQPQVRLVLHYRPNHEPGCLARDAYQVEDHFDEALTLFAVS